MVIMSLRAPVHVSSHPLVLHNLTLLRQHSTTAPVFRRLIHDLAQLLLFESLQDVATQPWKVQTPLGEYSGGKLAQRVGLFPILRAGLGMADAILQLLPDAAVWHLGLYRDHQTLQPVTYYSRLPAVAAIDLALVVDPMLATGGSARAALALLRQSGVQAIKVLSLIAAPEGVQALQGAYPDVPLYLGAVDSHLDEHSYIVPGLGDAGDRQFGTV
jgi:uracil phosphoribosyltransferase